MPRDSKGGFHLNTQRAMAADKRGSKPDSGMSGMKDPMGGKEMSQDGEQPHSEIHAHLTAMHEKDGGKHMHVHSHEGGHTTHHIGHEGMVEGPHEHPDTESMKEHVGSVMGEEHEGMGSPMMGMHDGY